MSSEGESVHCHIFIPSVQWTVTLSNELTCRTVLVCFMPICSAFNYIHWLTNRIDSAELYCWRPISAHAMWDDLKELLLHYNVMMANIAFQQINNNNQNSFRVTTNYVSPFTCALWISFMHWLDISLSLLYLLKDWRSHSCNAVTTALPHYIPIISVHLAHCLPEWLCGIASSVLLLTWLRLLGYSTLFMNLCGPQWEPLS